MAPGGAVGTVAARCKRSRAGYSACLWLLGFFGIAGVGFLVRIIDVQGDGL